METPALELVNSEWWYGRGPKGVEDQLLVEGWLERFLGEWGFTEAERPSPQQRQQLVSLRTLLRRLVSAVAEGKKPSAGDLHALDAVVSAAVYRKRIGPGFDVVVVPASSDWRWVLSEIAASFAEVVEHGDLRRLKVCANAECRWAFYDESKNRRRRWCGHPSCGDLDKVRRFRQRQRGGK